MDTGLSSSYFTEADALVAAPTSSPNSGVTTPAPRTNRRYKTQLRDFLSTCRSKRKNTTLQQQSQQPSQTLGPLSATSPVVDYIPDPAVVVAAYSNLNPMYSSSPYAPSGKF